MLCDGGRVNTEKDGVTAETDPSRRQVGLALLAAIGGSALLKGCDEAGSAAVIEIEERVDALTGTTNIRWVNKMSGTAGDQGLRNVTGAANHVAILTGYHVPGDGGGGVFAWSTTPAADDGGLVINPAGGTNAGWRRVFVGTIDARWFGVLNDGTPADQTRMLAAVTVMRDSELNVRHFAIHPDGTDVSAKVQRLIDLVDPLLGPNRDIVRALYFPAGCYRLLTSIKPPPGNHRRLTVRGDGWMHTVYPYGSTIYLDPKAVGGTVLHGDPNVDVFELEGIHADNGTAYRYLQVRDLAAVTTGTGICVNMHTPPADFTCGTVNMSNVLLAGGAIGLRLLTSQRCTFENLTIYGCATGLQLGQIGGPAAYTSDFYSLEVQYCNVGIEIQSVMGVAIRGRLIQGNGTHIRIPTGGGWGHLLMEGMHFEAASAAIIDCAPSLSFSGLFEFKNTSFGEAQPTTLYGNGWRFIACIPPPLNFPSGSLGCYIEQGVSHPITAAANSDVKVLDQYTAVGSTPFFLGSAITGTVTLDVQNRGSSQYGTLTGHTTIALPASAPYGAEVTVHLQQGASGGFNVSLANVLSPPVVNTGNTAGKNLVLRFKRVSGWILSAPQLGWF